MLAQSLVDASKIHEPSAHCISGISVLSWHSPQPHYPEAPGSRLTPSRARPIHLAPCSPKLGSREMCCCPTRGKCSWECAGGQRRPGASYSTILMAVAAVEYCGHCRVRGLCPVCGRYSWRSLRGRHGDRTDGGDTGEAGSSRTYSK